MHPLSCIVPCFDSLHVSVAIAQLNHYLAADMGDYTNIRGSRYQNLQDKTKMTIIIVKKTLSNSKKDLLNLAKLWNVIICTGFTLLLLKFWMVSVTSWWLEFPVVYLLLLSLQCCYSCESAYCCCAFQATVTESIGL